MFDFHEKRKIKSWVFSKSAILFLLVISFFLGRSVYERYQKERETAVKHAERAEELAILKEHAAALEAQVAYIESERGIEEEIRDRFDAMKAGERAVIVIDETQGTTSPSAAGAPVDQRGEGSWGFFSRFLFWR